MGCGASKKKEAESPKQSADASDNQNTVTEDTPGNDSGMTLYADGVCPFCQRVQIALLLKGCEFTVKMPGQPRPEWFLELNPKGTVPVLVHDGRVFADSTDALQYLDSQIPGADLRCTDGSFVETREKGFDLIMRCLKATMGFLFCKAPNKVPPMRDNFEKVYAEIEEAIEGPYWAGDSLTVLDCAFFPLTERWAMLEYYYHYTFPQDKFPKTMALYQQLCQQESFAQTKFPAGKVEKFKQGLERKARMGPLSTMAFTHTAFRQADKQMQHYLQEGDMTQARTTFTALARAVALHGKQEDDVLFAVMLSKLQEMKESDNEDIRGKAVDGIQALKVQAHEQHDKLEQLLPRFAQEITGEDGDTAGITAAYQEISALMTRHMEIEEAVMMPLVGGMAWEEQARVWTQCCQALSPQECQELLCFIIQYNPVAVLEALLHNLANNDKLQGQAAGTISRDEAFALVKGHTSSENWGVLLANCPQYTLQNV